MSTGRSKVGALVRRWRMEAGLSQEDLAACAEMSVRGLIDIERGKTRCPHAKSLGKLARALNLDQAQRAQLVDAARDWTEEDVRRAGRQELGLAAGEDHGPRGPDSTQPTGADVSQGLPLWSVSPTDFPPLLPLELPRMGPLIGREAQVERITHVLCACDASPVCAIDGMPGVGKTALAADITRTLSRDGRCFPGGAVWINCRGARRMNTLWKRIWDKIAHQAGLDVRASEYGPAKRRRLLLRALAQHPRTLLTLDNVEPGLALEDLVAQLAIPDHTAILLTTQSQHGAAFDLKMTLPPLTSAHAALLFAWHLKNLDDKRPDQYDQHYLRKFAVALGGLPLAIKLTAGYASVLNRDLDSIFAEIRTDGLDARPLTGPQAGLRACFERSWSCLSRPQQLVFAGLCLSAGDSYPRAAADELGVAALRLDVPHNSTPHPPNTSARSASSTTVTRGLERDARQCVDALMRASLVEALRGERLRFHPLLRAYSKEQYRRLGREVQLCLGEALLQYWSTLADASASDFLDSTLDAESAGVERIIAWAHKHDHAADAKKIEAALERARSVSRQRHSSPFQPLNVVRPQPNQGGPGGVPVTPTAPDQFGVTDGARRVPSSLSSMEALSRLNHLARSLEITVFHAESGQSTDPKDNESDDRDVE